MHSILKGGKREIGSEAGQGMAQGVPQQEERGGKGDETKGVH